MLVGKALSGGYMPVAAMVTTREIYQRAVGTLERSYVHQSTYGRNRLSMAAGLATMRIIERDGLVEHSARIGAAPARRPAELQQRHEMIEQVRASGLMIGIELGAPSSRVGALNWRLIHMASEGLFPQLIVIPLHRDHGVITMAAGKNDVIKLLPPLTLSENEAQQLPAGARRRARRLSKARAARTGASCATSPCPRCAAAPRRRRSARSRGCRERRHATAAPSTLARGRLPRHRRQRLHRRAPAQRLVRRGPSGALPRAREQRHLAARAARRRDRRRRPHASERSLARAVEGCNYVFHCGALVSDWATTQEITQTNVHGTRSLLEASVGASVQRFIHFSTTDVYGHPRDGAAIDETHTATAFGNWYAQSKLRAEAEVRRAEAERSLQAVILRPATVYGPGSREVVGEIARAIRARHMLLVDGGRAVAGLCYVDNLIDAAVLALRHEAAPGQAFNVSDGLDVTWRQFTDGLAEGLGCAKVRWSMPYWGAAASASRSSTATALLRRTTGLSAPPLLSRQAVQVLGATRISATAGRARLLGGSRAWITRPVCGKPSPGCAPSIPGIAEPSPT